MNRPGSLVGSALTARGRHLGPTERKARQVAMLLCRDETELTLAAIGERFGDIRYSALSQHVKSARAV
ncbi:helix-turn-helix domain-containing protein [Guyparkeria halopsychrophila]|uniref:helix-turn-helix domain-containing protein n=1 Tax=Guyparkeria halopsychrophila TaxID=3139421 RepID=UPI0037C9F6CF